MKRWNHHHNTPEDDLRLTGGRRISSEVEQVLKHGHLCQRLTCASNEHLIDRLLLSIFGSGAKQRWAKDGCQILQRHFVLRLESGNPTTIVKDSKIMKDFGKIYGN